MHHVAKFSSKKFKGLHEFTEQEYAELFALGLNEGAFLSCNSDVVAYVLPRDEKLVSECEPEFEVDKCRLAIRERRKASQAPVDTESRTT